MLYVSVTKEEAKFGRSRSDEFDRGTYPDLQ